jgi:manganese/zinc/iron transport system substrate-binding protein
MKEKSNNKTNLIAHIRVTVIALFSLVLFGACETKQTKAKSQDDKIQVVTTTGMIKDAVEHVAGARADVIALMGAGVDPHLYKATQGDLQKLTDADVIFYNGLHLEGKMGEVFEKLGKIKSVIAVTATIDEKELRAVPGFQGTHDPHIWFDVKLWENAVVAVSDYLKQHDPANSSLYENNAKKYIEQLDSLHQAVKVSIQRIPEAQRVLITAHDAFGYFGDAYEIEVRGLQGISTVSEFGLKDVTELVNFIIARKIKAIFVESSVSQRSIEAVREGCQQKGWDVKIGGSLYSDAMGAAGTKDGTYIGMVDANVRTIVEALK